MMARIQRRAVQEGLWIAGLQMVTDMKFVAQKLQRTLE
jgi:hypothetical protein